MKQKLPLSKDKKLAVIFRVEAGCLGAKGTEHVDGFCDFAQKEVETLDSDFVHWEIVPRNDKSLPEMQYKIGNKKLTHDKAEKYLKIFGKSLDQFEKNFNRKLSLYIDEYLGR